MSDESNPDPSDGVPEPIGDDTYDNEVREVTGRIDLIEALGDDYGKLSTRSDLSGVLASLERQLAKLDDAIEDDAMGENEFFQEECTETKRIIEGLNQVIDGQIKGNA